MRLNKKGYMLVEIIVSFTIAFAMLYFLMQIIINMKNINEDYYLETKLEADQLAMTKVVMDDILSNELESIDTSKKDVIDFKFKNGLKTRITILKKDNKTLFQYGSYDSSGYIIDDLYTKEIDKNLKLYDTKLDNKCLVDDKYIECQDNTKADKAILNITIPGYTTYGNANFGLNLDIPYKYGELEIIRTLNTLMVRNKTDYVLGSKSIKSEEIEEIEFLSNINIPNSIPTANTWDISEKQNKSILAWYTDNDNDGLYEIHMGQKDGVIANENSQRLFADYKNLTKISGIENLDLTSVTNVRYMFDDCKSIETLDTKMFKGAKPVNMQGMFDHMDALSSIDLSDLDTSEATDMSYMFYYCDNLTTIDFSKFKTDKVKSLRYMFYYCNKLTSLDLSSFNTKNVTDMSYMFDYASKLTSIKFGTNFNTEKVVDMSKMFHSASSITSIDLSKFNTKNVKDMSAMFGEMSSLTSIDVSKFDTSNVEDMTGMFAGCSKLTTIDLSNFNTKNVKSMGANGLGFQSNGNSINFHYGGMFQDCKKLKTIIFGNNFDTSNVTNMSGMFAWSTSLETLDITKFNTSNVEDMSGMFYRMYAIKNIYVSNKWSTNKVTKSDYMFKKSELLPNYNESIIDKTNAHYNSGGYLTYKAS